MSKRYYRIHYAGEHGPTMARVLASSQAKAEQYGRSLVEATEMTPDELFNAAHSGVAIRDLETGKNLGDADGDQYAEANVESYGGTQS